MTMIDKYLLFCPPFGMYLSLGLSFAVQVVEMLVIKKKKHFILLLFGTILLLALSGFMLWFETV